MDLFKLPLGGGTGGEGRGDGGGIDVLEVAAGEGEQLVLGRGFLRRAGGKPPANAIGIVIRGIHGKEVGSSY